MSFGEGMNNFEAYAGRTIVKEPNKPLSKEDQELMSMLEENAPKIYVVGTGGSGSNTINRMTELSIAGAKLVAMNTDAQHLLRMNANKKLLLGRKKTKGLGAGSNPEIGEAAAQESEEEIKAMLSEANMVFITCGLGGGTGTGSAHVIAKAAKDSGALVVAVVTLPFTSEGSKRMKNALEGLEKLKREADTTIAIPNDKLLYYVPDLPLNAAFKTADLVLGNSVKGITELITRPGLVNLDFADVRTILEKSGAAMIGLGEVGGESHKERIIEAAEKALSSPLLDVDVRMADKALINITGGEDMTLGEAEAAVNSISARIAKEAHVIWGATVDPTLENHAVRVLAVLSGIKDRPSGARADGEEGIDLEFV